MSIKSLICQSEYMDDTMLENLCLSLKASISCIQRRGKTTYKFLNLRALKFSPVNKIYIFRYGWDILCGISHKISYTYIERYDFTQHWNLNNS